MLEDRDWFRVDGAKAEDLARLREVASGGLPSRYLDLLAYSNGGEGPLAVAPYNLCLDPALTVSDAICSGNNGQPDLDGFLIFGSNGGGEYLAFDTRHGMRWPIVTIDMVSGGRSAEVIAPDFDAFYDQIGAQSEGA